MTSRFQPPHAEPVELGPVADRSRPAPPRPMDDFLADLFSPDEAPQPLIQAESEEQGNTEQSFPLAMWGWAAGTLALAITAIALILS